MTYKEGVTGSNPVAPTDLQGPLFSLDLSAWFLSTSASCCSVGNFDAGTAGSAVCGEGLLVFDVVHAVRVVAPEAQASRAGEIPPGHLVEVAQTERAQRVAVRLAGARAPDDELARDEVEVDLAAGASRRDRYGREVAQPRHDLVYEVLKHGHLRARRPVEDELREADLAESVDECLRRIVIGQRINEAWVHKQRASYRRGVAADVGAVVVEPARSVHRHIDELVDG
jgi:hypothetical protein